MTRNHGLTHALRGVRETFSGIGWILVGSRIPWYVDYKDGWHHFYHQTSVQWCNSRHAGWAYHAGCQAGARKRKERADRHG